MTFRRGNVRGAKLSQSDVVELRRLYELGWTQGRLAREYSVSVGQVGRIVRGESWTRLPADEPTQAQMDASLGRLQDLLASTPEATLGKLDKGGEE